MNTLEIIASIIVLAAFIAVLTFKGAHKVSHK